MSWRRTELQVEEARLAPLVAERSRLEAARREIQEARRRSGEEMLRRRSIDGQELEVFAGYRRKLEQDEAAADRQSRECAERVRAQRARIIEAQRRVRLLEKLRGRRLEEWRAAWDREQDQFASEAFLARWPGRARRGAA